MRAHINFEVPGFAHMPRNGTSTVQDVPGGIPGTLEHMMFYVMSNGSKIYNMYRFGTPDALQSLCDQLNKMSTTEINEELMRSGNFAHVSAESRESVVYDVILRYREANLKVLKTTDLKDALPGFHPVYWNIHNTALFYVMSQRADGVKWVEVGPQSSVKHITDLANELNRLDVEGVRQALQRDEFKKNKSTIKHYNHPKVLADLKVRGK